MRFWSETDANGKKLTDGRVCLVIKPDDASLPNIYTYGRDKEEVLEKVALTVETGQAEINRLRTTARAVAAPAPARTSNAIAITADEQARATADLSNPAKSPQAIKTLLRAAGVDLDAGQARHDADRMKTVAREWEIQHGSDRLWTDPRNQRLLMDCAVLHYGFRTNPTPEALDNAYNRLAQFSLLFEVEDQAVTVPPEGTPESRTVRNATSYRANQLRTTPPVVVKDKPRYTRAQLDGMNSRVLRDKIDNEPGFREWYNEFAAKSA